MKFAQIIIPIVALGVGALLGLYYCKKLKPEVPKTPNVVQERTGYELKIGKNECKVIVVYSNSEESIVGIIIVDEKCERGNPPVDTVIEDYTINQGVLKFQYDNFRYLFYLEGGNLTRMNS